MRHFSVLIYMIKLVSKCLIHHIDSLQFSISSFCFLLELSFEFKQALITSILTFLYRSFEELSTFQNGTVNTLYRPLVLSIYHQYISTWQTDQLEFLIFHFNIYVSIKLNRSLQIIYIQIFLCIANCLLYSPLVGSFSSRAVTARERRFTDRWSAVTNTENWEFSWWVRYKYKIFLPL